MSYRVHDLRSGRIPVLLVAVLGIVAGCSGEGGLAPPGEILVMQPAAPAILPEPPAPAEFGYPVSAPVDVTAMTSALPEGDVSQPVVTGIGTDTPRLAALPSYEDLAGAGQPEAVAITPLPQQTPGLAEQPAESEKRPLLAGLLPRFSNPLAAPQWAGDFRRRRRRAASVSNGWG